MSKLKSKAGGASRRGSHRLADSSSGCERHFWLANLEKLWPQKSNHYADLGTLLHTCMAHYYARQMTRQPQWFIEQPSLDEAIEADSQERADWKALAYEFYEWYARIGANDSFVPLYVEEEFVARVGDLDPTGEDEDGFEISYVDRHGNQQTFVAPNLNDEIVTCRPDLIRQNGGQWNYITDHKSKGLARNGSMRLPVFNENRPSREYMWQQCVNLTICRLFMPIEGFTINRVSRERPFDRSDDLVEIHADVYSSVPYTIRDCVKKERALIKRALTNPNELILKPWLCEGQRYDCGYVAYCYAEDDYARQRVIEKEYHYGE